MSRSDPGGRARRRHRLPPDPELFTRPTWVDAGSAYTQVIKGRATGNKCALWMRWRTQHHLFNLGCFIQTHCGKVLFLGLLLLSLCCVGLKTATLETNVEKLWVQDGGRLAEELAYTRKIKGEGSGSTYEIIIQTAQEEGSSVLSRESLLLHYKALTAAVKTTVYMYDITWRLKDICYATGFPSFSDDDFIDTMMQGLMPCMLITPLDCFWEGSNLLGPDHGLFVPNYEISLKWSNLNPLDLVRFIKESGFNFPAGPVEEIMHRAGMTTGYQEKPCLEPSNPECPKTAPNKLSQKPPDIGGTLTNGCSGFASNYMHWEEDLLVGGTVKNKSGHITRAEALQSLVVLMGVKDLYEFHRDTSFISTIDWDEEKAQGVLASWQREFTQVVNEAMNKTRSNKTKTRDHVYPLSSASLLDLLKDFSQVSIVRVAVGYCLMLVYACVSLLKLWDAIQSQSGVGIAGVLLVSLSVAAGLGMCSVLRLSFNASTTQIIPFLALGLGVDDMFLIAHTSAETAKKVEILYVDQTGECLKRIGVSVLLTSLSNAVAFFIAGIIPIPALRAFCLQAAVLVLFNLATILLVFPAVISLDLYRRDERRVDVFCCFTGRSGDQEADRQPQQYSARGTTPPPDYYEMSPRVTPAPPPSYTNCVATGGGGTGEGGGPVHHQIAVETTSDGTHPMTVLAPPAYDYSIFQASSISGSNPNIPSSLPPSTTSSRQCLTPEDTQLCKDQCTTSQRECCSVPLTKFARNALGPLLQKTPCKVLVIVVFLAILVSSIIGIVQVKDGLDITDVVPKHTQEYTFLEAQSKYFGFYNFKAVTKDDFDYAGNQELLYEHHAAFQNVDKIIKQEDGSLPDFWLQLMRDWLKDMQKAFDRDLRNGCFGPERPFHNVSDDGLLAYRLLIQTGDINEPVDLHRPYSKRLVDDQGIIDKDGFYNYLSAWTSNDALAYAASAAYFHPTPKEFLYTRHDDHSKKVEKSQRLDFAQSMFYLHDMANTEQIIATIKEIRDICAEFEARGLPNYPEGIPFTFWEQYINLRFHLMLALVCVLGGIFLVLTITLVNPWAAFIVVLVLAMMVVELFGFMGLIGIKMSAVPAVILIVSVGIGVEFTVHIVLGFITALGSRNKRMVVSLEHTFAPVIHGAMTTFLGVVMLAGAEFDFIIKYFFIVLTALVVLGLLNGLVLLPVLLSMIGPPSEVVPSDKTDQLAPPTPEPSPPPLRRSRQDRQQERQVRSVSRRVYPRMPSDISLTTITEEPTQSSNESSHYAVTMEPDIVVETTIPDQVCGRNCPATMSHVTTIRATANLKVEVHAPMPGPVDVDHSASGGGFKNCTHSEYRSKKRKHWEACIEHSSDSDTSSKS